MFEFHNIIMWNKDGLNDDISHPISNQRKLVEIVGYV